MRLTNKVAIVTGAAQGIGRAYAHGLAREGAAVVVADIKGAKAQAVASEIGEVGGKALAFELDITNEMRVAEMTQAAVRSYGGIDILVNNAAIFEDMQQAPLMDVDLNYLRRVMEVNVMGALICARAVVPQMVRRGKGKIINQASMAAYSGSGFYSWGKLSLVGLTRTLAKELASKNINVNAIAPGIIATDATLKRTSEERRKQLLANQWIQRMAAPEELVGTLLYLASDDSDYVTGQTLLVAGGNTPRI